MAGYEWSKNRDERISNDLYKNIMKTTLPTKSYHWYDTAFLKIERNQRINHNRKFGRLYVQKTHNILKNAFTAVDPSCQSSGVTYGENYQLQASKLQKLLENQAGYPLIKRMCLSVMINENNLNCGGKFTSGMYLSVSQLMCMCRRNVFNFESATDRSDVGPVLSGDPFYIKLHESGCDSPLYLQFMNENFDDFGTTPNMVRLTAIPDFWCLFKFIPYHPDLRNLRIPLETESNVVIRHVASGKNLNVEYQNWVPTLFGNECLVSCRTVLNHHRMECVENVWVVLGAPAVHKDMLIRAARGEDIPEEMII